MILMAWILGAAVLVVIVAFAIAASLPVKHVARTHAVLHCQLDEAWRRLTTFSEYPSWRREIKQMEPAGPRSWREVDTKGDAVTYECVELVPPSRLVRRISDRDLPYGGTWTFELAESSSGHTEITITEDGEVYNLVFRFVSRFLMGHHGTMTAFLEDFARTFADSPLIVKS
jgi:uncharacterized protein YndB with AHSA1/START domain